MSWLPPVGPACAAKPGSFEAVFAHLPELHQRFREFEAVFWRERLLPPTLLELARLRVAQLLRCEAELRVRQRAAVDDGLDEAKIAQLPNWPKSPAFSECERDCLRFTEAFVLDPHGISDADAAAVVAHLGDPGIVALTEALALFEGFGRFRLLLGVEPGEGIEIVDSANSASEVAAS